MNKNKLFLLFIIFLFSNIFAANSSAISNVEYTGLKTESGFSGESSQFNNETSDMTLNGDNKNGMENNNKALS